jgi:hypothetical protein
VLPVSARVATPAKSAFSPLFGALFWVFSAFVLCIPFVSPVQTVFVLHKFYWNLCWLISRSALFYFESMR